MTTGTGIALAGIALALGLVLAVILGIAAAIGSLKQLAFQAQDRQRDTIEKLTDTVLERSAEATRQKAAKFRPGGSPPIREGSGQVQ